MKQRYIDVMEKALSAYTYERIVRFFNDVKTNGLTEHGFPRLTANIGVLVSRGRRTELIPLFLEMMEFCCKTIPTVKAANDFSVREIVGCLWEVESSGIASIETTNRWRSYLAGIERTSCYTQFAKTPVDNARNWALFTTVSEFFRQQAGLCDCTEFIELHMLQQQQWLDENGMYMDGWEEPFHQPIVYDLVPRGLFSLLLDRGYRGKHYQAIDGMLKKAALLTLDMQSPTGEIAFGGRSNQFVLNEPWMIVVYEYEAKRYAREGNMAMATRFKAAASSALDNINYWLSKEPIHHVKNRFPTETEYGCEGYAYFDKYMITVASNLYPAYLICDESIPCAAEWDDEPCATATSKHFHKLFLKSGGYGLEFELNADYHYDANGLGRIHRADAPPAICLSCPCPLRPTYKVDIPTPSSLSLCSAVRTEEGWLLGAEKTSTYEVLKSGKDADSASATLACRFENGMSTTECYTVSKNGVDIVTKGEDEIAYILPAFCFDGEVKPEITVDGQTLSVTYDGWVCRYTTDGEIVDLDKVAANRNGHYRAFAATGKDTVSVKVEILKV
ncbi:MAG: hypothetical protein IIX15_05110 [Clostridia bacterium]|nr:hypothetical protein [Clostridia bacterium]